MTDVGPDGFPLEEQPISPSEQSGISLFSPSRILLFMSCRNKFREEYLLGNRSKPSSAASFGSAIHEVIEEHCNRRKERGSGLTQKEVKDFFSVKWMEKKAQTRFEEEAEYDDLGKEGEALVESNSVYSWLDSLEPRRVEFPTQRLLPGRDYGVFGYVDLEEMDTTLNDFKTTRKSPSKDADGNPKPTFAHMFQLSTYGFCESGGTESVKSRVVYIVRKKVPEVVKADKIITPEMMASFTKQADIWIQAMRAETMYPPNRSSTLCNPKYCGAWDKCHKEY